VYNPVLDRGVFEFNFTISGNIPGAIVFGIFDADNTDSSANYFQNSAVSFCCAKSSYTCKYDSYSDYTVKHGSRVQAKIDVDSDKVEWSVDGQVVCTSTQLHKLKGWNSNT